MPITTGGGVTIYTLSKLDRRPRPVSIAIPCATRLSAHALGTGSGSVSFMPQVALQLLERPLAVAWEFEMGTCFLNPYLVQSPFGTNVQALP